MTRETGSTTNLYRTGYAYSYASYHRQVVRTEQEPLMAAWEDKNRVTYKYDGMERNNESQARMPAPLVARGLKVHCPWPRTPSLAWLIGRLGLRQQPSMSL